MPPVAYAILVCGVLAFANWGQWQRGKALQAEAAAVTLERDQALADLTAAKEQSLRLQAAQRALNRKLAASRAKHDDANTRLAALPVGPCLDADLGDPVASLFSPAAEAPGAGPADVGPEAGAGVPGTDG